MTIIEIENLVHRFADGTLALDGIDLTLHEGTFTVLAGGNGSGKTTLLRHLNGLCRPTGGRVRVDGISVDEDPARARRLVGMVFQDPDAQIVGETVADDVAFGPENLGLDRETIRRRVAEALSAMGLTHMADQRPHALSGGEKRRLAMAGVLAMDPRVVALDEPFDSLDFQGVRQVLARIVDLHRSGRTVIVTTHDIEKVIAHAERMVVLERGRVALDGRPEDLLAGIEALGVREPCLSSLGRKVPSWLN